MQRPINLIFFLFFIANLLTKTAFGAAGLEIPPCPTGSNRVYMPDARSPIWTGCKDKEGLYQGLLIQFSSQTEMIRAAGVKDSLRDGREIRFGNTGTLEERNFKGGHLNGKSFIFKSESRLANLFPKNATAADWLFFTQNSNTSALQSWLKKDPESTIEFRDGRLSRIQFEQKDYQFNVTKEGRMFALNHPEMKNLFFTDTEPLWVLNAADLKRALLPGFGSCKKYAGPIGRFGRYYDHLLYKRESSEKKHLEAFREMLDRFIKFCVPEDIMSHLGVLECPPQLPTTSVAVHCQIPVSDQLHIPYESKYFTYEFTLGRAPDELHEYFREHGVAQFVSSYSAIEDKLDLSKKFVIQIKRSPKGTLFRPLEKDKQGRIKVKKSTPGEADKDWYDWKRVPGY